MPHAVRILRFVACLALLSDASGAHGQELTADLRAPLWAEPGAKPTLAVALTNTASRPATVMVRYSLQRASGIYDRLPPDPVHGTDHALGAKSWTEAEGKRLETGSLTDGLDWTGAETAYRTAHFKEAVQTVDLGRVRRVTHMAWLAGDANWIWKADVEASRDGASWRPVPSLQGVDMRQKWGRNAFPLAPPFEVRYLRLRYHNGGQGMDVIRMPVALSVYDGTSDGAWDIPSVGRVVAEGTASRAVEPDTEVMLPLTVKTPLTPGAYFLAARVEGGGGAQLHYRHLFVAPPPLKGVSARSRFGLNSSKVQHNPSHQRLGIGWVRFENMKWPMISPEPGAYRFDGTVKPWVVRHDEIVEGYAAQGLNVLPFLFLTPDYATSAPASVKPDRRSAYPPRDNAQMAEFVFQTVTRYGSQKHPEAVLKSSDRKSGLNRIHVWEIWNEPNLTDPAWGPWVGTAAQYLEMFRASAEAVKRADPRARVTNGGYAGIETETVNALAAHRYADGKRPLDFVDILNVHYYSGRTAPEVATVDTSVDRSGAQEGRRTYEDDLRRLAAWRDRGKPGLPIWLTETGYDTGGPWGVSEAWQAARLPRVIMLALANGIEKVFVYREAGSTPSLHAASGLFREDGTPKPSWFSYATLIRELDGVGPGARLPHPNPNVRLALWRKGAEPVLAAWTVDGTAPLALDLGVSTVTDAFGHRERRPTKGLRLSTYPVYIRGIGSEAPLKALEAERQRQERERQRRAARLSRLRAYLFDFGTPATTATLDLGKARSFTPVTSRSAWGAALGHGFTPGAAMGDDTAGWIADPLDRTSTRVASGTSFLVRVAPGRYVLRVAASPFGEAARLTLRGAAGGPRTLEVRKDAPPAEVILDATAEPLSIGFDEYVSLRWLTVVEAAQH
jgi:hypothetical protein